MNWEKGLSKGGVSGITLTLLLIGMLTSVFNIQAVKAEGTIYIRPDGTVDPPTAPIQRDGDVYTLTDNIYDSIVVERNNIVVDGSGYTVKGTGIGRGIDSGRSNVTVKNMEIKAFDYGIYLHATSGNTVSGNNITNNDKDGIYLDYCSNNNIFGNNVANNWKGIELHNRSSNNSIAGNNITANNLIGIELSGSSKKNNIAGNNVANNNYGIRSVYESSNNSIAGNNVANNNYGIYLGESSSNTIFGNNITANNYDGISLPGSSNNSIAGNNITANNYDGIYLHSTPLYYCSNNNVSGNNIANNGDGIVLIDSDNNNFKNNHITDNRYNLLIRGDYLQHFIHNIDTSNTVNGKPVCYMTNQSNLIINASTFPNIGYLGLVNSANMIVRNLNITNNGEGVLFAFTTNSTIENVDVSNNGLGIYLHCSSGSALTGNIASENSGCGIYLYRSSNNTLTNNAASSNQCGIYLGDSSNNTLTNNAASSNEDGIHLYCSSGNALTGNIASENSWRGIYLGDSSNNTLTNNAAATDWYGIRLIGSSNNTLINNAASSNLFGIMLSHSRHNVVRHSNMTGNEHAFGVYGSPLSYYLNDIDSSNTINGKPVQYLVNQNNLTIDPSTFADVGYLGIVNSTKVKVKDLDLTKNTQGLMFAYTNDSSIMNVNVSNNEYGIYLAHSHNNIVSDVTIGSSLDYGIYLESANNNTIYHNNFINNAKRAYLNGSFDNKWDNGYPFGGNFWSNYAGVDLYYGVNQDKPGSDGIGDTPLTIDANNIDAYPLMGPFGPLTMKGEKSTVFPSGDVGLIFENVVAEGSTTADKAVFGPEPPSGFELVGEYYDIKTTASYSGKIETRIIYGDSGMTQEEEEDLQLMQWNETSQQWINTTTRIDTQSNVIYGETSHLSMFGVTRCSVPLPPVANFTWTPYIPEVGKSVTFDASSSTPNGGEIVSYKWNFGDDHYDSGEIVSHTYTSSGTYTITLNVTDSEGLWDTAQKQIRIVQPHGPEAEFEAIPDTALTGESIKLDASASLPGWNGTHEMPIVEYRWDFGGAIKITTSTPIFYYSFISPGIYYVTLTVYAPGATPETDTTSRKVTIISVPIGGYSLPIRRYTTTKPLMPYMILVAILTSIFATIRRETHRRTRPRNAK